MPPLRQAETVFLCNPAAGRGRTRRLAANLRETLSASGVRGEWLETREPGEATALAERSARDGAGTVVAIGGDGTVNEAVDGLMRLPAEKRPAFGHLPTGTGNDYAKTLGLTPRNLGGAVRVLGKRLLKRLDVGEVNGRFFANGVGVGFDGAVAEGVGRVPWLGGVAAYVASAVTTLATWRNFRLRLEADGEVFEGPALLACVSLGRCCGGGFYLTPSAEPDDGLFDLCTLGDFGRLEALWSIPKALSGRHVSLRKASIRRARRVTLSSDRPLVAHLDGNLFRQAASPDPLVFGIHPGALEVVGRWEGKSGAQGRN